MIRALQAGLVAAFREGELAELAATRLGVTLDEVAEAGTLAERALELVQWANRAGRLCELAQAAAEMRPQSEQLRAVALLAEERAGRAESLRVGREGRRVGTPPVETERVSVDHPGDGNGVQRSLGDLNARMEALEKGQERTQAKLERVLAWQWVLVVVLVPSLAINVWTVWTLVQHVGG